ncbi:MAG: hypothetical protein KatS3mg002_1356 [Candidatus Woesearchaeota archaeon]|nr:MAG: hypothetical protein KatS3mg002_1356 [Candidatus Woesearchaeota archaeon]
MKPRLTVKLNNIDEKSCYELYFRLLNIFRDKEMRLTEQQIDLSSIIAAKSMDYIIDSKKSLNGKSKKYELAKELGIKEAGIYSPLKELVEKKILEEDSEGFYKLTDSINKVRKQIKKSLETNKFFEFDYIFEIKVNAENS